MPKTIKLAENLQLPLDAVTQKGAILGMSGSGKSYGLTKLAEGMLEHYAQLVILDPKGEAYGLRLNADGKTAGYSIPVFGGDHGDVPLRPDMGKEIADLLVKGDYSAVLDVSEFTSQEIGQFGYHFATQLLHLKKRHPGAMCLMLDEAEEFIPQNPSEKGWEPKMLHAFERLQKQGRAKGVGFWIAGQRPQEINKKVLNLSECWLMFRLGGLQERETVQKLIGQKDKEFVETLQQDLPRLDTGTALVWSPWWLNERSQHLILPKTTFDSSATPEVGARKVEARELSKIDIAAITVAMQDAIDETISNDPKTLKAEIAKLKTELIASQKNAENMTNNIPAAVAEPEIVYVPVLDTAKLDELHGEINKFRRECDERSDAFVELVKGGLNDLVFGGFGNTDIDRLLGELRNGTPSLPPIARFSPSNERPKQAQPAQNFTKVAETTPYVTNSPESTPNLKTPIISSLTDFKLTGPQQKLLDAIALCNKLGMATPTRNQIAGFSGYSNDGTFRKYLSQLNVSGLIEYPGTALLVLSEIGRSLANSDGTAINSLGDLHDLWRSRLTGPQKLILNVLIDAKGAAMTRDSLAASAGYSNDGTFRKYLSQLHVRGIIEYPGTGLVRAAEVLFPQGLS